MSGNHNEKNNDNDKEKEILTCAICGEENDDVFHTLRCGHTFHYGCLYNSFKNMKNNTCPYCRSNRHLLPIIPGLKKVVFPLHFNSKYYDKYDKCKNHKPLKCKHILTRGKNKDNPCGKNCKLGYEYCGLHYKKYIKKDEQILV